MSKGWRMKSILTVLTFCIGETIEKTLDTGAQSQSGGRVRHAATSEGSRRGAVKLTILLGRILSWWRLVGSVSAFKSASLTMIS